MNYWNVSKNDINDCFCSIEVTKTISENYGVCESMECVKAGVQCVDLCLC